MSIDQFLNYEMPDWIRLVLAILSASVIVNMSIPTIVKVSRYKNLFGDQNDRNSHTGETPNLGGLAVFAGFTVASIIFSLESESTELKFILGAAIILFFTGLKDDILVIDPKKKLIGQIVSALIVIWLGGIRITNLHHALNIDVISTLSSIIFSLFVAVLIINSFNLIDGIDGLASGIGVVVSTLLGAWFIYTGNISWGVISLSLAASLTTFFRFNIFSSRHKVFLGDTGSLLTGLIIYVLIVKFLEMEPGPLLHFRAAPAIAFALIIIPLFDTLRVFTLRIWKGKSPFKADRNHLHHLLLALGLPHLQITIILISFNLLFILFALFFQSLGSIKLIVIMILAAATLSFIPRFVLKYREKR